MGVTYSDLFEDVGEFVERVNQFRTWANTDLETMFQEIAVELNGNGRYDVLNGVSPTFEGYKDTVVGWAGSMASKVTERLTHLDTVLEQLALFGGSGIDKVLEALIRDMIVNVQTVKRSTATVGAVTVDTGNNGYPDTAQVLTTKALDGVTRPGSAMPAHAKYVGVDSELVVPTETMTLVVAGDSESDGLTEGNERLDWTGGIAGRGVFDWRSEASGSGPRITAANGAGLVSGGEFEMFAANVPSGWTIDNGVAGTTIFEESTAAQVHRGSKALKFTGTGAAATLKISQAMGTLTPRKGYCLAFWLKGGAAILSGTLDVKFEGTGYTAAASEKVSLTQPQLASQTAYGLKSFFINLPVDIPSDFKLTITVGGTLTSGASARIDGLVFAPVNWHGGVGLVVVGGKNKLLRGDKFSFSVSNDALGVFQEFFRRYYKVQLPSSITPSISDALAAD